MSHWHVLVWIRIWDILVVLPLSFIPYGESHLLVSWCAGDRCDMVGSDVDRGSSRRLGTEDRGWSHKSGTQWPDDRKVRWCCVWSAPCMRRQGARDSWFGLKTKGDGLSVVWPQNQRDGFSRFGLKTSSDGFPGLGLKTGSYGLVIWASKSPRRFLGLGHKTKQAMIYQLCHKTDRRMTTAWGTHQDLAVCFA
jgi:hypothetical protein